MYRFIIVERQGEIATLTLNRLEVLNAWHAPMRQEIVAALVDLNGDEAVRAIIITGAGERAFSAGQDLAEAKNFDADHAASWIDEWRAMYQALRDLDKPLVAALNGVAAGSAFQVALLADLRVGHPGTRMGQPEINVGIASTLGPWLMRERLGLSRTIELTLSGRLMDGAECHDIGLIHYLVPQAEVLDKAREVAQMLASKPPVAMRLDKRRFREMTKADFEDALQAGVRTQREAYATGEPQAVMAQFLAERSKSQQG